MAKKTIKKTVVAKPEHTTRRFSGEVVKISGSKTVSVQMVMTKMHPKYNKQYHTTQKYAVHDENSVAKVGDVVTFEECRPISASKRWRIIAVNKKA